MLDNFNLPTAYTDISRVVSLRDNSLEKLMSAVSTLDEVFNETSGVRKELSGVLHGNGLYTGQDKDRDQIFGSFSNVERVKAGLRRDLDVAVWRGLMQLTNFDTLMDATAKRQFDAQLEGDDVPEVTEENVRSTFQGLFSDADTIFKRGIATAFTSLDRRFKSHNGFKIGSRVIVTNVVYSMSRFGNHSHDLLKDIERTFAVLDGVAPEPDFLPYHVKPCEEYDTRFFLVRTFQNGNAHLWFKRDDLVEKVNKLLGEYYGDVIPDAWETASEDPARAKKAQSTAVSTDLQFYATPSDVADALTDYRCRGAVVLEPSAGEGSIVVAALQAGAARIDCVEVDSGRIATLNGKFATDDRVRVRGGNFLAMTPREEYDMVLMNPPFFGTHYMKHVQHAHKFLKKGGVLKAVLPITVDLLETKAHKDFRKWAKSHGYNVRDLPLGSFKESGTNVSTCVLTLHKR